MDYQFNGNDLKMKTGGLWKRLTALQVAKLEVENNFVYTSIDKIYLFLYMRVSSVSRFDNKS